MKNVAIVGCGRIFRRHIRAVIENDSICNLVAICDIDKNKAKVASHKFMEELHESDLIDRVFKPLNIYTDYDEMYRKEDIDIVVICTESGNHYRDAMAAMKAGKHVLVEKPMALSIEHCDEMIAYADAHSLKLGVSHQNRFNPPVQRLKKAVDQGRFGKIYACNAKTLWRRTNEYYNLASWRGTKELDGGCLMNQCVHNIDLLQWIVGDEVVDMNCMIDNFMHEASECEDYGSVQLRFKNRVIGNVEGTVNIFPENLEHSLTVLGEKGTVKIDGVALNRLRIWKFADRKDNSDDVIEEVNYEVDNIYGRGHTPLLKDFITAVNEDRRPYIDGREAKKSVEIILKVYEACEK